MAAPDPPRLAVTAALIFRAGRLLISQRRLGDDLGGLWEFPGGKIEPGETPEGALRREIQEELGVQVCVHECVAEIAHDYPERGVHIRFFRCAVVGGEPAPVQGAALAWVTRAELAGHEFPAADAALLDQLRRADSLWRDDAGDGPAPVAWRGDQAQRA